jgi:hypothetical protein
MSALYLSLVPQLMVISCSWLTTALASIAVFSDGRAQIGARIVGDIGAGGKNCWLKSWVCEQLNVLAATTRTPKRRI